jgi:hypothetical protein
MKITDYIKRMFRFHVDRVKNIGSSAFSGSINSDISADNPVPPIVDIKTPLTPAGIRITTVRIARTNHVCVNCKGAIHPGLSYTTIKYFVAGKWIANKYHRGCHSQSHIPESNSRNDSTRTSASAQV